MADLSCIPCDVWFKITCLLNVMHYSTIVFSVNTKDQIIMSKYILWFSAVAGYEQNVFKPLYS